MGREVELEVEYTEKFESLWNRLTQREQDPIVVPPGADESTRSRSSATKHRPFTELPKDCSPERRARLAAITLRLVDDLKTETRERRRGQAARQESSNHPAAASAPHPAKTHATTGPHP